MVRHKHNPNRRHFKRGKRAKAQNYPPFLHQAELVLANEFRKLEQQDWQEWRHGRMMRTMRSVGAFKTSTASAEQSFWPYGNDLPPVSWTDLCWKTPV